ncbi:hypothetical protein HPB50_022826 [Hyalomma asiaticum]|uniref:Uncharacterized protein n=1 Tax=Hyalomma asiaticum TaxID=266040 RepID=A0ACB7TPE9_HYAAI|nr:hypothetical protein HPB50_022826 [Hyalomma asiaticum]
MAAFTERELRVALLDSSGLTESNTQGDLTRTNLLKNVFTMSTACQDRVVKYAQIRQVTLRGKKIEIQAYIAPPDQAIQGIIYRAYNGESPREILRELRRSNPLVPIMQARDMSHTSKSVLICFVSDRLPESVKFFGSVFGVYPFGLRIAGIQQKVMTPSPQILSTVQNPTSPRQRTVHREKNVCVTTVPKVQTHQSKLSQSTLK